MDGKFLIGAATAAHQVEGNNIHSDYWLMEHMEHTSFYEPSGMAVDHYNRYEEDIRLLKEAGLNAYRFSIEWARIEPEEGCYDEAEIEHYRRVLLCCRENQIEPVVTMMHFTSPAWLIRKGGWESSDTAEKFAAYCRYVVLRLGSLMHYVVTINEANMGIQVAAIAERYKRQMLASAQVASLEGTAQIGMNFNAMMENMRKEKAEQKALFGTDTPQTFVSARTPEGDLLVIWAHQEAKKAMKEVCPDLQVGLSLSLHDIQSAAGGEERAAREWEDEFTHYLPFLKEDDFFGLQNYSRERLGADGILPVPEEAKKTQMEYENYPQALEHVIRRVHEALDIPILITENGIATADDAERCAFIETALDGVRACKKDGIPVLGYLHWSLLDNFEWQKGFAMTFGLIAVDRSTQKRMPKQSLYTLGKAIIE